MRDWLAALAARGRLRVRGLLSRDRVQREIDTELRYHLAMTRRDLERNGLSPRDAQRQAGRRFGNVEGIRDRCRDLYYVSREGERSVMHDMIQDLRYAVRGLLRSTAFSAVVVGTLALGIGANTAIFSIIDGVLLRPLPYHESDRLVRLWQADRVNGTRFENFSLPDYFDVLERNEVFDGVVASEGLSLTLTRDDAEPRRVTALRVGHGIFPLLGVQPELGRPFLAGEDVVGAEPVAVLSSEFFRAEFGGDVSVIGRTIALDGERYRVLGVMGAGFAYPGPGVDLWMPLQMDATSRSRGNHNFRVLARLADGVPLDRAQGNLAAIAAQLEVEYADQNEGREMWGQPLIESVVGDVRRPLVVIAGAVALVLLVACVNVANLLYARSGVRSREVAVRAALGAGRPRLVQQFLTESLVLAAVGGVLGIAVAVGMIRLLTILGPSVLPRQQNIDVDLRVLLFALAATVVTGLVFGTLPAWHASKPDLHGALKEGGRAADGSLRLRMRRGLVVSEVALAVVLVAGAGLLLKSFWRLQQVDPGFDPTGVVTMAMQLPAARYPQNIQEWPNWSEVHGFHERLLERVRAVPGVTAAGIALNLPTAPGWTTRFSVDGEAAASVSPTEEIRIRVASSGYFEALRVQVVRGRLPETSDDRSGAVPVAVINETAAKRYFPNESPLGRHIGNWGVSREIVGVVRDVHFMGIDQPTVPAVYPTFASMPFTGFSLVARTQGETAATMQRLREVIWAMDRDLAITNVTTLPDQVSQLVAGPRFNTVMIAIFATTGLLLAAVGIYGVMAYSVNQRRQEMGVRLSLGATPGQIVGSVVRQGLLLTAAGLGLGLIGATVLTRSMQALLFEVQPFDPTVFVTVAVVGLGVAIAASYGPARRASRMDPVVALRRE